MTNTRANGDNNMVAEEKTQLMEGDDAPPASFKWTIEGFSKLIEKKYSEIFDLGGVGWRLLIFPEGNYINDYVSVYLTAADSETKSQNGWSIDAQFSITLINQIDDKLEVKEDTQHRFNAESDHSGFLAFVLLTDLSDPNKGYLVEDTCVIEVKVTVKSVVPPKKTTKTPSKTQSLEQKKNSLDSFEEPPTRNEGSSAKMVSHIDPTESAKVILSQEPPRKSGGSTAPRGFHIDPTDSAKITQPEELPKNISVSSSNEKSPADGNVVIEEHTRSEPLPSLFQRFGSMKVRNPPYSLPNGCRITEGAVLDEGDMAAQLIQSALLSSELQPLMEMPVADLTNQGYCHLAKFLHYHCASIIRAQWLQIKHQENANVSDEIKLRDLKIQELQLCLGKSAEEASKLRGDLEKVNEEKVKVVDEFSAAKEKIINLEGELQLLCSENIDLQIQLENARQAEQNA